MENTEGLGGKLVPLSFFPPKIPHGIPWTQTRASEIKLYCSINCKVLGSRTETRSPNHVPGDERVVSAGHSLTTPTTVVNNG
jgi:hypothetical protein